MKDVRAIDERLTLHHNMEAAAHLDYCYNGTNRTAIESMASLPAAEPLVAIAEGFRSQYSGYVSSVLTLGSSRALVINAILFNCARG